MSTESLDTDIVVLVARPAGYPAAISLARADLRPWFWRPDPVAAG
jgi:thioredoxin reductase